VRTRRRRRVGRRYDPEVNWLAHLRLAPEDPLLRIGNLCGDFVAGVDLTRLPPELQRGIWQHRAIDRFVDAHPVMRRSRQRLGPGLRRFAGVMVDVFYDHFLARDWAALGDGGPLPAFAAATYALLERHAAVLPDRLREALPAMRAENWLASYARLDGIDLALARMATRLRRPSPLGHGGEALRAAYAPLGSDFAELWPDLVAHARQVAAGIPA
jgi:acyl carrier protein phosphodiesterase